jgi:hypothetical protein
MEIRRVLQVVFGHVEHCVVGVALGGIRRRARRSSRCCIRTGRRIVPIGGLLGHPP